MAVAQEVKAAGLNLRSVWAAHKKSGVVRSAAPSIEFAIRQWTIEALANGRRPGYVHGAENYFIAFARGRSEMPVDRFMTGTVDEWFAGRNELPSTKTGNLGRLASLFSLCWRRGWISENPCERILRPHIERNAPRILAPHKYSKILYNCADQCPAMLGWVVCGLLAGLRPEETVTNGKPRDAVGWSDVDLKNKTIRVDTAATKVRQRQIGGNAIAAIISPMTGTPAAMMSFDTCFRFVSSRKKNTPAL
jgi:site-specific recombinase XerD